MKELIKKLLRENLIQEKLANVDLDVDFLYDTYFKNSIEYINKTGHIDKNLFNKNKTNTSILKSEESIKANELNPCTILVNHLYGNHYNPNDNIIGISINPLALNYVIDEFNGDLQNAINSLEGEQMKSLMKEFTEDRIKGGIHHELAHWLDDTFHNKHIKKRVNKSMELGTNNLKGIPVNSTKMEIEGQIHNIKQAYNKYRDIWDEMTFDELVAHIPTLNLIRRQLNGDVKNKWFRDLKTRMYRENLLGKNMVNK